MASNSDQEQPEQMTPKEVGDLWEHDKNTCNNEVSRSQTQSSRPSTIHQINPATMSSQPETSMSDGKRKRTADPTGESSSHQQQTTEMQLYDDAEFHAELRRIADQMRAIQQRYGAPEPAKVTRFCQTVRADCMELIRRLGVDFHSDETKCGEDDEEEDTTKQRKEPRKRKRRAPPSKKKGGAVKRNSKVRKEDESDDDVTP